MTETLKTNENSKFSRRVLKIRQDALVVSNTKKLYKEALGEYLSYKIGFGCLGALGGVVIALSVIGINYITNTPQVDPESSYRTVGIISVLCGVLGRRCPGMVILKQNRWYYEQ